MGGAQRSGSAVVLIGADDALRDRITALVASAERASSLDASLDALPRADLVVVALATAGEGAVRRARAAAPLASILAVCAAGAEREGLEALRAGADDVVSASSLAADLVDAVERALARRRLVQNERRLSALTESGSYGVTLSTPDGVTLFASRTARRLLGMEDDQNLDDGTSFMHPDDALRLWPEFLELQAHPGATRTFQFRAKHGDGRFVWLESVVTNLMDEPGVNGLASIYSDITDRKLAEARLSRSEASFRTLIERWPDGVLIHREGIVVYANPALLRLLGTEGADEVLGRAITELAVPEEHERVREGMHRTSGYAGPVEMRLRRKDGAAVHVESEALELDFDGKPAVVTRVRDLGERRALLARLAMADRMQSVGTLAAGVAHEINNPLAYVITNLSLLDEELPYVLGDPPDARDARGSARGRRLRSDDLLGLIRDAREGAARVRAIVRDLRTLSRADDETSGPVDLRKVIESAIKMARTETRHRARVVEEYADVPPVHGNETRLGQVFLNLLVNAAQAIPDGHADSHRILVRTLDLGGGRVGAEVHDTGVGIPAAVQARIFDPFFTTKPLGAGTGLGLSICHGILQSMGGDIRVESSDGHGSVFHVALPAAPSGLAPREAAEAPLQPAAAAGRVLVVDDEPFIGSSLRILLAPELEVVAVTRAADALARIDGGERFDAILSDLMMPDMNGMELYRELQKRAPDVTSRVIFLTGGAFTASAQEFLGRVRPRCLEKPFDVQTLRSVLREVMGGARSA